MYLFWRKKRVVFLLLSLLLLLWYTDLSLGQGFCATPVQGDHHHHLHHHHHHHHDCDHDHDHDHQQQQQKQQDYQVTRKKKIPEELAEDDDEVYELGRPHDRDDAYGKLSGLGVWLHALGCSLLVSLASLICLLILPIIFVKGKPSKDIVDALALFGAGAMLGDAFLHQLPHAFGGEHSHSHDHHHEHSHSDEHSHSHSLKDLSVGLSILAGIVLFLVVEKVVRYVDDNSHGGSVRSHGHYHHHHGSSKKLKDDNDIQDKKKLESSKRTEGYGSDEVSDDSLNGDNSTQHESKLRKRNFTADGKDEKSGVDAADSLFETAASLEEEEHDEPPSNLVFGYLNLFSDGVHNFTDGMALGSAFLLYGSVGGWSRTLFLLAHELPQEVGDFGILVRSGFSVVEALFFNFLSALVALAGTAMALLWGQDPGQSSLIEGFTAGGFIYIAVAGVLAEMNTSKSSLRSTAVQITSLLMGMAVALFISLVE